MRTAQLARQNTADLIAAVGPDAPTSCEGWTARDLAAHLVVRDRRPDAMPGIVLPLFAGHTDSVQQACARRTSFPRLVELVRSGPPRWSPMRLPLLDQQTNLVEYAVHAEDVRRANDVPGLPEMPAAVDDDLWKAIGMFAKLALRSVDGEVAARCAGRETRVLHKGRAGAGRAEITGGPRDVMFALAGRGFDGVSVDGDPEVVRAVEGAAMSM